MSKEIEARLGDYMELLKAESLDLIDFDALISDLEKARGMVFELRAKSSLVDRVTEDVKGEVRRMLLAITRVRGESASTSMVAKLLQNPDLSYQELKMLKREVVSEFNRCLPTSPFSRAEKMTEEDYLTISEFK